MPLAPLRLCSGCRGRVPSGQKCPTCTKQADCRRGTAHARGYTRTAWDPVRRRFLAEFPLCGMRPDGQPPVMSQCHARGLVTPAHQVDHVVPHKGNEERMWDWNNLQALCASCGARKSQAGL